VPSIRIDWTEDFVDIKATLDTILGLLQQERIDMSELTDAVGAMKARVDEDVSHLLDLLAQANARAEAAAANDAADAAAIAQLQAENQAAMDDATATVAALNAIDPVADFPEAPPSEEPSGT